jgi:anti-sigma regulatory factor (Ser/Thr protein kinase)
VTRTEKGFDARPDQVRAARQFVLGVIDSWGLRSDVAILVASELAANALSHARSAFTVALRRDGGAVVVEVRDASPDPPAITRPPPDASDGRGLLIVDRLARAWGSRPVPSGGKIVWAELDVR